MQESIDLDAFEQKEISRIQHEHDRTRGNAISSSAKADKRPSRRSLTNLSIQQSGVLQHQISQVLAKRIRFAIPALHRPPKPSATGTAVYSSPTARLLKGSNNSNIVGSTINSNSNYNSNQSSGSHRRLPLLGADTPTGLYSADRSVGSSSNVTFLSTNASVTGNNTGVSIRVKRHRRRPMLFRLEDREINAGIYMLKCSRSGHVFLGTTWDLRNAQQANLQDLLMARHVHGALNASVKLHGVQSIEFQVLESIQIGPNMRRPLIVKDMENRLRERLWFHRQKLQQSAALQILQRMFVSPAFRVWRHENMRLDQELEALAAVLSIQSSWWRFRARQRLFRMQLAKSRRVLRRFMVICQAKHVILSQRRQVLRQQQAWRIQQWYRWMVHQRKWLKWHCAVQKYLKAIKIQRLFRGFVARKRVAILQLERRKNQQCIVLQSFFRGCLARRACQVKKARWLQQHNAVTIQRLWRGFCGRQRYATLDKQRMIHRRRHHAALVIQQLYWQFVAWKFQHMASDLHCKTQKVSTIHLAYRSYCGRKFNWIVKTYLQANRMACRIQRPVKRFLVKQRFTRLCVALIRQKKAILIQCWIRRFLARCVYTRLAECRKRDNAALVIQRFYHFVKSWLRVEQVIDQWQRDRSATRIQAAFRGFQQRRQYQHLLTQTRRARAVLTIQCFVRCCLARQAYQRRLGIKQQGECQECHECVAVWYAVEFELQVCQECCHKLQRLRKLPQVTTIEVHLFRQQTRQATRIQAAYRGYCVRLAARFGICSFCQERAIRVVCRQCHKSFCFGCCDFVHARKVGGSPAKATAPSTHDICRIERFLAQQQAAICIQKHWRRFQQRNTLHELALVRDGEAACKIQRGYRHYRVKRKVLRLADLLEIEFRAQKQAAQLIQRQHRGFVARKGLRRRRQRRDSAIRIQCLVRGHQARVQVALLREQHQAASQIQRAFRGYKQRQHYRVLRDAHRHKRRVDAATCIQRHWRGHHVRLLQYRRHVEVASGRVQLAYRCYRAKTHFKALRRARKEQERLVLEEQLRKRRIASATTIQRGFRGFLARSLLRRMKIARARDARMLHKRFAMAREKAMACVLQLAARRRLEFINEQMVVMQKNVRRLLAQRLLSHKRSERTAAVRIQRAFRYFYAKQKLAKTLERLQSHEKLNSMEENWVELFDESSGLPYYYNVVTQETRWDLPGGGSWAATYQNQPQLVDQDQQLQDQQLWPSGEWVEYWDENVGTAYYYNTTTGEATWAKPDAAAIAVANSWSYESSATADGQQYQYDANAGYQPQEQQPQEQQQEQELDPIDTQYQTNYKIYLTSVDQTQTQTKQNQNQT